MRKLVKRVGDWAGLGSKSKAFRPLRPGRCRVRFRLLCFWPMLRSIVCRVQSSGVSGVSWSRERVDILQEKQEERAA